MLRIVKLFLSFFLFKIVNTVPLLPINFSPEAIINSHRNGKVLNFVSLPVSRECLSDDHRRSGVCLNNYECKIQEGVAHGNCALGFGVCCVFTASCGDDIKNNVTYLTSPNFPGLTYENMTCPFQIHKIAKHISQIRLDFIHFTLGQPNRQTGICDSDEMVIHYGETQDFRLCGFNSGQHLYLDVEESKTVDILMNLTQFEVGRIWEIKVTQIEFPHRAPSGCLQYHRKTTGTIRTMNYAINGRHLADQDYTICIRQALGMCSIVYEPCDANSFRIGPPSTQQILYDDEGSGFAPVSEARADECSDRIVMPCDSEEFITPRESIPGVCDLLHCGNTFCTADESPCRIESSTTPFNIHVYFGKAVQGESPDDNLGMCLRFEQQKCS